MEASFQIHFLGAIGYRGRVICLAIANRWNDTIDIHYQEAIKIAIKIALLALSTLRNQYPGVSSE